MSEFLDTSEPIIEAVLEHMDSRTWPLSLDITKKYRTTFSLNLGYDIGEPSTVFGAKLRFPFSRLRWAKSLDVEVNRHSMTSERLNDDYYSASAGFIWHRGGGSSLLMPTWGIGYERSSQGDIYKHEDNAIFLTAGFFAEMINIKWSHRWEDVDDHQSQSIRSNNRFLISFELGRIFDILI